jgi:hypothetical protein
VVTVSEAILKQAASVHLKESCETCGGTDDLQPHHIDGDTKNNSAENIFTLCSICQAENPVIEPKSPIAPHPSTATEGGSSATFQLSIRLSQEDGNRLKTEAERKGMKLGAFGRKILLEWLNQKNLEMIQSALFTSTGSPLLLEVPPPEPDLTEHE